MSAGYGHMCSLFDNGKMKCWGFGASFGLNFENIGDDISELGDNLPYFNPGTDLTIKNVACGGGFTCILLNTDNIKCFGENLDGEVIGYVGDALPIVDLGVGIKVLDIASATWNACTIITGNKVKCFGAGYSRVDDSLPIINLGTNYEVSSIHSSPSTYSFCAIFSQPSEFDQRIKCWGLDNEMGDNLQFVDLGTESRVIKLALGYLHTCALLINNIMKCWGGYEIFNGSSANFGQLGSGTSDFITSTGDLIPIVLIDNGKFVNMMSAGDYHTCIVLNDNLTMKCFGKNEYGQLGQGDKINRGDSPNTTINNIPAIDLGTGNLQISSIQSGENFNCVLFTNSKIKCFGGNLRGQLGVGLSQIESIGDGPNEVGLNLKFVNLFSTSVPTFSPTSAPTFSPTKNPTKNPTKSPTNTPTKTPTKNPTNAPTKNPTKVPTNNPTKNPTNTPTKPPTKNPTNLPTKSPTVNPTTSKPTTEVAQYNPPSSDCYMILTKPLCESELNSYCGPCVYFSDIIYYGFRVRINFIMEHGKLFIDFDNVNASPPKTAFRHAVKALIKSNLNGEEKISINRLGQIYQVTGSDSGYVDFEFYFIDNEAAKSEAIKYFQNNPNLNNYVDDLNLQLNKIMKTTGRIYITGTINFDYTTIIELTPGAGSCGCKNVKSNSVKQHNHISIWIIATAFIILNLIVMV